MKRAVVVLGLVLGLAGCGADAPEERPAQQEGQPPETEVARFGSVDEARNAMAGVWLFAKRDMALAGSTSDGIRFDDTGRWQLLDVLADGKVVPAAAALTGSTSFIVNLDGAVTVHLSLDTGGVVPMHVKLTADGQRMRWESPAAPNLWELELTNVTISEPMPLAPVVPRDEASARAALQGVWLFDTQGVRFGGSDGIRFDAGGRFELLVFAADGTLVPKTVEVGRPTGTAHFGFGTLLALGMAWDDGSGGSVYARWSDDWTRMQWQFDYDRPLIQLRRSDLVVPGTVPPRPWTPASVAEVLSGLAGVWLFEQPDRSFLGVTCDGIRFDATGRWQTLDVLEDGSVVPSAAQHLGTTVPLLGLWPVQLNLQMDDGGGGSWRVVSSAPGDTLSWMGGSAANSFSFRRSSATVSPPMPPPPWAPTTEAEGLAALEGVWLFSQTDQSVFGAQADGIRFDATGRWQLLDVLADGQVAPAAAPRTGATRFYFFHSPTQVDLRLLLDTGDEAAWDATWSAARDTIEWTVRYTSNTLVLRRSDATVTEPMPPPPWVPATEAEGLAALGGVWLFEQPDRVVLGKPVDGIRFDAGGRWQTLDVLEDGRVVPSVAQSEVGLVSLRFFDAVYMSLNWAFSAESYQVRWSAARDTLAWWANGEALLLRRSDAVVAEPMPPPPDVPATAGEAFASLVGTWRFAQPDTPFRGVVSDGVRFDADGTYRFVDVGSDGQVTPGPVAGAWGFGVPELLTIDLLMTTSGSTSTDRLRMHWTDGRTRMRWRTPTEYVLTRL